LSEFTSTLADRCDEHGALDPSAVDLVIAQARALRRYVADEPTPRMSGPGSKARIRRYFEEHVGEAVTGEELRVAAGTLEWARRVRELRKEGLKIQTLEGSRYVLTELPDRE
jgi:hypothetical protein